MGVMFENHLQSQKILDIIQKRFHHSIMSNYYSIELEISSIRLFFWERLVIDDQFDTHSLKKEIEKEIPNSIVFINELIPVQSKLDKYLSLVVSSIIAVAGMVAGLFL